MLPLCRIAPLILFLVTLSCRAELEFEVEDVTVPAGKTFAVPLRGQDAGGAPITYSIVSIANPAVTGTITSGNRSLKLNVTGKDAGNNTFTGDLVFQLFEDLAPVTTTRIIQLVQSGFYNGLTFHRIIDDFMAQGGDPAGNGSGGTGTTFTDEYSELLTFVGFGQLAMANSGDDSNDSQFFITDIDLRIGDFGKEPPQHLNFNHTIFGQLTGGFDVFENVILTPVSGETPLQKPVINNATVFTDVQRGVLLLSAATNFTGTVTVTVSATSTHGASLERTFTVNVVADTTNDRPFLREVPHLVMTANATLTFGLEAYDHEKDSLTYFVLDAATLANPANVQVTLNNATGAVQLKPKTGFTGRVSLFVAVRDQTDRNFNGILNEIPELDSQIINLDVIPPVATHIHEDGDGDKVRVQLRGNGILVMAISRDAAEIGLGGTDSTSTLAISTKKSSGGDGFRRVASLSGGGGLKSLLAKGADLTGDGLNLGGQIGALVVHDILPGTVVQTGGTNTVATKIIAHEIADNAEIVLKTGVKSLTAARIGRAVIEAPNAGKVRVKGDTKNSITGDFAAALTLTGPPAGPFALKAFLVKGSVQDAAIVAQAGHIGIFKSAKVLNSVIYAGFSPITSSAPFGGGTFFAGSEIQNFLVTGTDAVSFAGSFVAADIIGSVKLTAVPTDNGGVPFGILGQTKIGAVQVTSPSFQYDPTGPADQSVGDFHVTDF
jgi:cyclophilin family peptidyl-prolyl cis-trans isomerase